MEYLFFDENLTIQNLSKDKILPAHEKTIKELDFSNNQIDVIGPFAFKKMENLEILRLRSNKLDKLSRFISFFFDLSFDNKLYLN